MTLLRPSCAAWKGRRKKHTRDGACRHGRCKCITEAPIFNFDLNETDDLLFPSDNFANDATDIDEISAIGVILDETVIGVAGLGGAVQQRSTTSSTSLSEIGLGNQEPPLSSLSLEDQSEQCRWD